MPPLLILKLGSTFPSLAARCGDFDDWIRSGAGLADGEAVVLDPRREPLPDSRRFRGVVITGSHAMVTDREDWSERTAAWIPQVLEAEVPLLGICYGHQLLAHALGGEVDYHPRGRELGTVEVTLHEPARQDPLFKHLPPSLLGHVCHAQSVRRLPPGAVCLASNAHEPHHAFAVGRRAWGVQFHPEFDAEAARTYICESDEKLRREGLDPDSLLQTVRDTPDANALLRRFAELTAW